MNANGVACDAKVKKYRQVLAGAGAGLLGSIFVCPLDVVKLRQQQEGLPANGTKQLYRDPFSSLLKIWRDDGIAGFYRGLAPTTIGYLSSWATYFAVYERTKTEIASLSSLDRNSSQSQILSAIIGGSFSACLTNPIWIVRTRMMTGVHSEHKSVLQHLAHIWRVDGLWGFYKGLLPSLLGLTHVAVQFPLYEQMKLHFAARNRTQRNLENGGNYTSQDLTSSDILIASSLSKSIAATLTYPHEVVRTRLHNQSASDLQYSSIFHCVRKIYRTEGLRSFYNGLTTNLLRGIPSAMVTLYTYEVIIGLLE